MSIFNARAKRAARARYAAVSDDQRAAIAGVASRLRPELAKLNQITPGARVTQTGGPGIDDSGGTMSVIIGNLLYHLTFEDGRYNLTMTEKSDASPVGWFSRVDEAEKYLIWVAMDSLLQSSRLPTLGTRWFNAGPAPGTRVEERDSEFLAVDPGNPDSICSPGSGWESMAYPWTYLLVLTIPQMWLELQAALNLD